MDAQGDHRIAMLGAVAGLVSPEGVELLGAEPGRCALPDFFGMLRTSRSDDADRPGERGRPSPDPTERGA